MTKRDLRSADKAAVLEGRMGFPARTNMIDTIAQTLNSSVTRNDINILTRLNPRSKVQMLGATRKMASKAVEQGSIQDRVVQQSQEIQFDIFFFGDGLMMVLGLRYITHSLPLILNG